MVSHLHSFQNLSELSLQPSVRIPNVSYKKCFSVTATMNRPLFAESISAFSYKKFVNFAVEETAKHTSLSPSPLQERFNFLIGFDEKTELQMLSFEAPKIRLARSLFIEGSNGMNVLDLAIFPKPEFDLPIFCANFFTTSTMNIVVFLFQDAPSCIGKIAIFPEDKRVNLFTNTHTLMSCLLKNILHILDLNPLHDVINHGDYKDKYYKNLIPLVHKYSELFPWGGKITSESLKFFSPIVIWTKFSPSQHKYHALYSAFTDYLKSWLELMDKTSSETDCAQIMLNLESQHRYLTWRAEKDPGHQLLRKLVGETHAKEIVRSFLFNGVDSLSTNAFIDYFPEYKCDDGGINQKRSMIGKSFETRPWDSKGDFIH